jgi:hypothetical protein
MHVTATDTYWPTDPEDPMTLSTSSPEQALIADLPATLAGLWTALTLTDDTARHFAAPGPGGTPTRLQGVADACAQAAQSLAVSAPEALNATNDLPAHRVLDPTDALNLLSDLASSCIDLAVELLGNEAEPLASVEVLAVTRAVTALCVARGLVQGGAA